MARSWSVQKPIWKILAILSFLMFLKRYFKHNRPIPVFSSQPRLLPCPGLLQGGLWIHRFVHSSFVDRGMQYFPVIFSSGKHRLFFFLCKYVQPIATPVVLKHCFNRDNYSQCIVCHFVLLVKCLCSTGVY